MAASEETVETLASEEPTIEPAAALDVEPVAQPEIEPAEEPEVEPAEEPTAVVSETEPTMTGGPDAWDKRTHIERINPGDNPAYVPGLGIIHSPPPMIVAEPEDIA